MAPVNMGFSPEILHKLETKGRFIEQATKAVNEFAPFPGPDGEYYGRLAKITASIDKTKGHFIVKAFFAIVAYAENGSQEFANNKVRIQWHMKDTEKQTEQDAWNRLYTDLYQALGCITAAWEKRGNIIQVMSEETARLNTERPAVLLSVTAQKNDARYHNVRILQHLSMEAINHFIQPTVVITEEDEKAEELLEETVGSDFKVQFEQAEQSIMNADEAAVLGLFDGLKPDLDPAAFKAVPLQSKRRIMLAEYVKKAGQDPTAFGLFITDADWQPEAPVAVATEAASITMPPIIEEDDEPVKPIIAEDDDSMEQEINSFLNSQDREGFKRGIVRYEPTAKFGKSMTDESLRDRLAVFMLADKTLKSPLIPF